MSGFTFTFLKISTQSTNSEVNPYNERGIWLEKVNYPRINDLHEYLMIFLFTNFKSLQVLKNMLTSDYFKWQNNLLCLIINLLHIII